MSEVAQATSAWPLALNTTRTVIVHCNASQTPVAMPQPTRSPASRIDRVLTAERPIVVLIALRVTSQAKFERIDLERDRKFVHRAFERVDAGRGAWTAHVARRRQVEPSELVHVLRVRGLVE